MAEQVETTKLIGEPGWPVRPAAGGGTGHLADGLGERGCLRVHQPSGRHLPPGPGLDLGGAKPVVREVDEPASELHDAVVDLRLAPGPRPRRRHGGLPRRFGRLGSPCGAGRAPGKPLRDPLRYITSGLDRAWIAAGEKQQALGVLARKLATRTGAGGHELRTGQHHHLVRLGPAATARPPHNLTGEPQVGLPRGAAEPLPGTRRGRVGSQREDGLAGHDRDGRLCHGWESGASSDSFSRRFAAIRSAPVTVEARHAASPGGSWLLTAWGGVGRESAWDGGATKGREMTHETVRAWRAACEVRDAEAGAARLADVPWIRMPAVGHNWFQGRTSMRTLLTAALAQVEDLRFESETVLSCGWSLDWLSRRFRRASFGSSVWFRTSSAF